MGGNSPPLISSPCPFCVLPLSPPGRVPIPKANIALHVDNVVLKHSLLVADPVVGVTSGGSSCLFLIVGRGEIIIIPIQPEKTLCESILSVPSARGYVCVLRVMLRLTGRAKSKKEACLSYIPKLLQRCPTPAVQAVPK